MYKQIISVAVGCIFFATLMGQTLGLRSPGTRLQQINTDTVQIIFAEGQYQHAARVATLAHHMARTYPIRGSDRLRKIPIILQDATDISNGYVGLGPWRSEFYQSPPQNSFQLGSLPWTELLAIHEWRHVQQRSVGRRGLSKLASILFGEEAYSAMLNLSWPNWYTEGDAVIAETVLTNQGRGRVPAFLNGYREKILSGEDWPYHQARNGSYRQLIPSHYSLGFLLQNYGRAQYGQDFWDAIVLESAGYQGLFYPFSAAIERRTGMDSRAFYHEALDYYRQRWQGERVEETPSRMIGVPANDYVNYRYPVPDEAGGLYVVRTTFDHTAAIYRINGDSEEKIVSLGSTLEPVISYAAGKFCWAERRVHPRWMRQDHSAIVIYDTERKARRTLSGRSSYFAPALSPDGKRVAALVATNAQQFNVHVLDATTGNILAVLPNPANLYFSYPAWDGADHIVSAARDTLGRMMLTRQTLRTGEVEVLTEPSFRPIGRAWVTTEWICFAQSGNHVEQIFRLNRQSGRVEQVTTGMTAWYQPVIDPVNGDIIAAAFSLEGHRLKRIDAGIVSSAMALSKPMTPALMVHLEEGEGDLLSVSTRDFPVSNYSHWTRPVNFHSWNLYEEDPVYGIELLSENVLGSIGWRNGFRYNNNDDSYGPFSELTIGVWYPEILLSYSGWRRKGVNNEDEQERWFTQQVNGGLRLPFRAVSGLYAQNASVYSGYGWLWAKGDREGDFGFLTHSLVFTNRRIQAYRHPMTRFGQAIRVNYSHGSEDGSVNQLNVRTDLAVPSPLSNHVLWLQYDFKRDRGDTFSDFFSYARGYNRVQSDWIYRVGANYHFPVVYPDFGVAGIVYFKRLRANLFFDYSRASLDAVESVYRSAGVELMFDLELFNVEPVTVGWRWSQLLDADPGEPTRSYRFGFFTPFVRL